jgi:hypothetical protein
MRRFPKRRVQISDGGGKRERETTQHTHEHLFSFSYSASLRSGDAHILARGWARARERLGQKKNLHPSERIAYVVWVRAVIMRIFMYACMCGEKKATPPAALLQSLGKTPRLCWKMRQMQIQCMQNGSNTALDFASRRPGI